jgi:hypothetical protein
VAIGAFGRRRPPVPEAGRGAVVGASTVLAALVGVVVFDLL